MPRPHPIVIALAIAVLAVTPVAGTVAVMEAPSNGPTATTTVNRTNTSDILRLPQTEQSAIERPSLNLSIALSVSWDRGRDQLDRGALVERFESASTPEQRQTVLMTAIDSLSTQLSDLLDTERSIRLAYVNGNITAETYLNRLGELQATTDSIAETIATIDSLSELESIADRPAVTRRLLRAESRMAVLRGPLREDLASAVLGDDTTSWVYIAAAESGVTLSTVRSDQFIHETARLDNFADEPSGGFTSAEEALQRWSQIYPTVWDPGLVDFTGLNGAYRAELPFDGGRLESYLDANRLEVYRELQVKDVPGVPVTRAGVERLDGFELTVNRTFPGGPLEVTFGETDGTTLDGIVRVNGIRVARTGKDGTAWVIGPAGQFTVTVDYGDRQLTLVVEPSEDS